MRRTGVHFECKKAKSNVYGAALCQKGCKQAYTNVSAFRGSSFCNLLIIQAQSKFLRMARQVQEIG
jgi:hypothetical protein